jgi:hypothetical protein
MEKHKEKQLNDLRFMQNVIAFSLQDEKKNYFSQKGKRK